MLSDDKHSALEFAAKHFEAYGVSHMQFGKPWTGIQLAEVIRACMPSAGLSREPAAWLEIDKAGDVIGVSREKDQFSPFRWEPLYRAESRNGHG